MDTKIQDTWNALILKIASELNGFEIKSIAFLSNIQQLLSRRASGIQLFDELIQRKLITYGNHEYLRKLLVMIGRKDLESWLTASGDPGGALDANVDLDTFKVLLFQVFEDLSKDQLENIRFYYRVPRRYEIEDGVDMCSYLIQNVGITAETVGRLCEPLKLAGSYILADMVSKYAEDVSTERPPSVLSAESNEEWLQRLENNAPTPKKRPISALFWRTSWAPTRQVSHDESRFSRPSSSLGSRPSRQTSAPDLLFAEDLSEDDDTEVTQERRSRPPTARTTRQRQVPTPQSFSLESTSSDEESTSSAREEEPVCLDSPKPLSVAEKLLNTILNELSDQMKDASYETARMDERVQEMVGSKLNEAVKTMEEKLRKEIERKLRKYEERFNFTEERINSIIHEIKNSGVLDKVKELREEVSDTWLEITGQEALMKASESVSGDEDTDRYSGSDAMSISSESRSERRESQNTSRSSRSSIAERRSLAQERAETERREFMCGVKRIDRIRDYRIESEKVGIISKSRNSWKQTRQYITHPEHCYILTHLSFLHTLTTRKSKFSGTTYVKELSCQFQAFVHVNRKGSFISVGAQPKEVTPPDNAKNIIAQIAVVVLDGWNPDITLASTTVDDLSQGFNMIREMNFEQRKRQGYFAGGEVVIRFFINILNSPTEVDTQ